MDPEIRSQFVLDPSVTFLNHGSFGACPRPVLELQTELRGKMEREPVHFFTAELEPLLDEARAAVAGFVGAEPADLGFVRNATTGVNAVLSSLRLAPGDELLVTDHGYNACSNAARRWAERSGARVVIASLPFPVPSEQAVIDAVLAAAGPRTKLALIDHVTSPTGLVLPVARIVPALAGRGIDTLVDGAHAPGMLPLDLRALGAAYYTGNLHKWCCAPKGAGFLFVRRDRQEGLHPAVTSHGANATRRDRSRFLLEFDWVGTDDYTPMLCVPAALRFLGRVFPGGWPELMRRNRALALEARRKLAAALAVRLPCPDEMIGTLAALPLPDGELALQAHLYERHRIQVPIVPWPAAPHRLVRVSAQIYNRIEEYQQLGRALRTELGA